MNYKNKILSSGVVNPNELIANPKNWRRHPEHQKEALDEVLSSVGWVQDVIVNKTTGLIVDGHLRVELALSKGETEIPVKYVNLTETEEAIILATIDPIAALAETDKQAIKDLSDLIDAEDDSAIMMMLNGVISGASIDSSLMQGMQDIDSLLDEINERQSFDLKERESKQPAIFFNVSETTKKKWTKMWVNLPMEEDEEKALAIIRIMDGYRDD